MQQYKSSPKKAKIEDELQSGVYDWIFLGKK